jgi:signal peptidase I
MTGEAAPAAATIQPASRSARAGRLVHGVFEAARSMVVAALLVLLVQAWVAQPFQVQQRSMHGTIEPGEYVLVDKLSPRLEGYQRGDIVVFLPPDPNSVDPFCKRVIGLPGEVVELRDGRVWIDGRPLDEPYLAEAMATQPAEAKASWVVPDGALFVLGDNRAASFDSRSFGPISRSLVIGRVWLRYWPAETLTVMEAPTYGVR